MNIKVRILQTISGRDACTVQFWCEVDKIEGHTFLHEDTPNLQVNVRRCKGGVIPLRLVPGKNQRLEIEAV